MVTLQNMPEEIKSFIVEHRLVRPEAFADEHQVGIQLALNRVIGLVMSSLGELAEQPSGREVLWSAADEAANGDTSGAGPHHTVAPQGAGLVRSVLDDRYHGTVHAVATAAGLQTASVGRLIDVVTAAALEVMGGLAAEYHWNAQELGQWLRARPAGRQTLASAGFVAEPAFEPEESKMRTWLAQPTNVLLLLVSFLAVGEFGYIVGTRPGSADDSAAGARAAISATPRAGPGQYAAMPVANLTPAAAGSAAPLSKPAVPVVLKLKNGVRQIIGANSTESKLYQFLIDPAKEVDLVDPTKGWIGFDRIYFETNKAVLTNESLWQLSNVASILKRFPAAKIKIGGYTDSSGNPLTNLRLSQARADAALSTLVSMGVPADHLTAAGYGTLNNLASNDTEEGRSLNRRVSLQVTYK